MIYLKKANLEDCALIHSMQVSAFKELLHKYKDVDTNPGAESVERIIIRMKQDFTDYYLIQVHQQNIGAIRIIRRQDRSCRISPMFLVPEFQGRGYAQQVVLEVEKLYPQVTIWSLDTIKEVFDRMEKLKF